MEAPYLNSLAVSVWKEPHSIVTIRHSVRLHTLVGVITCLSSNPLHPGRGTQVNLQPLIPVIVLSNPASSRGASILRLQSGAPGTIVVVVHGGGREHRASNATVSNSKWHIATIYNVSIVMLNAMTALKNS